MNGLSLTLYTIKDIIKKAEAWCMKFDDFVGAKVYDDKNIKMYSYLPNEKHDRLGDIVIFEKNWFKLPKLMFVANKTDKGWWKN